MIPQRLAPILILGASGLALGGCLAGIAASAVGMAARSIRGVPESNAHLAPEAAKACSERASQYGTVKVIDVEQQTVSRLVVWGTASQSAQRSSFECHYTTEITRFKLRPLTPSR